MRARYRSISLETMVSSPAVVVVGLTRSFGETVAVRDLSLEVQVGEVFGLLGHNGAGKTTTIRLLTGVLLPDAGTITVLGYSPVTDGTAVRAHSGVLAESPGFDERLTARENLAFFAELFNLPLGEAPRRITGLLEEFGLAERADDRVSAFSKGMKQRLALARCLLHDPDLLFLDEPTAGLDPVATREVHELIRRLSRRGRTIFLCTHNLGEAQRLCDRVAVLRRGQLVALGRPTDLTRQFSHRQRLDVEIEPDRIAAALEVLARFVPADQAVAQDDGVVTVTGIAHGEIPRLIEALVQAQIPVYRVTPRESSLEDVYLALHGEEVQP